MTAELDKYQAQTSERTQRFINDANVPTKKKTLVGALIGLIVGGGLLGAIIGALVGSNKKSENLNEAERQARKKATQTTLAIAKENKASKGTIDQLNHQAKKAEYIADNSKKSNKTFWGSLKGLAVSVALVAGVIGLGFVSGPIAAGVATALIVGAVVAPATGAILGSRKYQKEVAQIEKNAEEAARSAEKSVSPTLVVASKAAAPKVTVAKVAPKKNVITVPKTSIIKKIEESKAKGKSQAAGIAA